MANSGTQAQIVFTSGPFKDRSFSLASAVQSEFSIGRDVGNNLSIPDKAVSKVHCAVVWQDPDFHLVDRGSRNGTHVQGRVIQDHVLHHGDQISIGSSTLVFADSHLASLEDGAFFEEDDAEEAPNTIILRPTETLYLKPDQLATQLPSDSSVARNLSILLQASQAVHSIRDPRELQEQMLNLLFEATPAERAAILLCGAEPGKFISTCSRYRALDDKRQVGVSQTITKQVVLNGHSLMSDDAVHDGMQSESMVVSQVRAFLCAPLSLHDRTIGCIYLDTRNAMLGFTNEHLQLVTAFAGISAVALENARRLDWLEQENQRLSLEVNLDYGLIGNSAPVRDAFNIIRKVASADATTVLILGESGTGKELAARAIHRLSGRASKPFAAINCAAMPDTLIESELFGHVKGAFSGAVAEKKGRFEAADGGVVFLDEIGEMPLSAQAKLLRVVQEREIVRVGGTKTIPVNVRIIAATNRNLEEQSRAKTFREDLYHRLNVVNVTMPPLRDRRDDIPTLAEHFVSKHARKSNLAPRPITPEAMALLVSYDWPGNVRELENSIERAMVLGSPEAIFPDDLAESILDSSTTASSGTLDFHAAVKATKKALIHEALDQSSGSKTEAAKLLGLHPNYLHRLLNNLGIKDSGKENGKASPAKR